MSKLTLGEIEARIHEEFKNVPPEKKAAQKLYEAGVTCEEMVEKKNEYGGTCLPDWWWDKTWNELRDLETRRHKESTFHINYRSDIWDL